eukprot:g5604.t1
MKQKFEQERDDHKESANQQGGNRDAKDYYQCAEGEELGDERERFVCISKLGVGVYSSVFKCRIKGRRGGPYVAVKIIRRLPMMTTVANKEIEMYVRMAREGPKVDAFGSQYLMYLYNNAHFEHHQHKTMVFELMKFDLRVAADYYRQKNGFPLATVALWGIQILFGLRCLRRLEVIHADLKPDNVLLTEDKQKAKICDFGTSMSTREILRDRNIQPRYYRAPEVFLGLPYDTQIDVWSCGCTLYELATGKILFTGQNDNLMIQKMMEVRGGMPRHMATDGKGKYVAEHFDRTTGDFLLADVDEVPPAEGSKPGAGGAKVSKTIIPTRNLHGRKLEATDFKNLQFST